MIQQGSCWQSIRSVRKENGCGRSSADSEALPLLARGAALRFLLTRLYDWLNVSDGALVTKKDPLEYYHRLRFHRAVSDASAYGIAL